MSSIDKTEEAYKTIGEVTKELGLVDKKTGRLQTHTIRYWETQFRQIKPNIKAGGRRYYSAKIFKIIK
jgi:DNA-binding transcriptional MerR regulator